jgi:hypothetical protein
MSEHKIQNEGRNALAQPGIFNSRANVGKAWTGSECIRLPNGDMLIKNPRPFDTGLPPGFTDTFGVTSETITPEMVGQAIGVAHFIEFKTPDGRVSPKQQNFITAMRRLGARAGVARSAQDAVDIALGRKS